MEEKKSKKPSDRKWGSKNGNRSKKLDKNKGEAEDATQDPSNDKKRKREEVMLTEEEIAEAKKERSRKKWKKADEKVRSVDIETGDF